ncbi:MAG: homoserine dehydrogenase [Candidatus Omnitrophica bacterium]|nr:homoserine dehydrogenase [Candidatus Omnitrophota bacterium]
MTRVRHLAFPYLLQYSTLLFGGFMRSIRIGLLGLGQIGSSLYKLVSRKAAFFQKRYGVQFKIARILVKNMRKKRFSGLDAKRLTSQASQILKDPSIDVVVELIGGVDSAKKYVLEALRSGKDVITANKALLAEKGEEISALAGKLGRQVFFEASVGGGIPVIKTIREGLGANRIDSILGIVNGTCNYILTQMSREGLDFQTALEQAQKKGFAEPDPSFDIDGIDSAHKIAVLARLAFEQNIPFRDVYCEGIRHITEQDINFAKNFGYCIKLLAIAKRDASGIDARVQPTLVPQDHILAKVDGSFNAILLDGDETGEILLYGRGAGPEPTASAVMSDLIDYSRGLESRFPEASKKPLKVKNISSILSRYYLRFSVLDQPGVLSKIAGILGKYNVSISDVIQSERKSGTVVPLILLTHHVHEKEIRSAVERIDAMKSMIRSKSRVIRIEA